MTNPEITVINNTESDHVREGEKKKTESGKECKELIPYKMTKLRHICIYKLKEHMNAYSGWMPGHL